MLSCQRSRRGVTRLAEVFDSDDGWVGLSEYIENIDMAFKMVAAKLLQDAQQDADSMPTALAQRMYTCLSRMSRACGDNGHSSVRKLLLSLVAPSIQLSQLMEKWPAKANPEELRGLLCSLKSASSRVADPGGGVHQRDL